MIAPEKGGKKLFNRDYGDYNAGNINHDYLTIIPRARMGCESIAHEAEGRMGY